MQNVKDFVSYGADSAGNCDERNSEKRSDVLVYKVLSTLLVLTELMHSQLTLLRGRHMNRAL